MANSFIKLNIPSPSRAFAQMGHNAIESMQKGLRNPFADNAPPWYAARGPNEPWPNKEIERKARLLRRRIKRDQHLVIRLFWHYMGVYQFGQREEIGLEIVQECLTSPLPSIGDFIRASLKAQFEAHTVRKAGVP